MFLAVLLFNVREQLPFLVGLTNTERQTLPKMSPVNRAFTEDAISVISNNTDMFPAYLDGVAAIAHLLTCRGTKIW